MSNRHMTWWQNAWWVRVDNGPHMRSARGRRRTWRAARQAAEQVRDGNWVGETRWEERETEKGRKGRTRARQEKQRGHPSPDPTRLTTTAKRHSNSNNSSSNAPAMSSINRAAAEAEAETPGQVQNDLQRGVQMQTLAFQARVRTRPTTTPILPFWLRGGFQRRILSRLRQEDLRRTSCHRHADRASSSAIKLEDTVRCGVVDGQVQS